MWEIEGRYRGDGYGEREEIERKMREAYECGYCLLYTSPSPRDS